MKSQRVVHSRILSFLVVAGALACGPGAENDPDNAAHVPDSPPTPAAWDATPEARWSLREDLRIGSLEGGTATSFGRIRNLIPASDGGVWVYDELAYELRRFGPNGLFAWSAGKRGDGPGEFSRNACARPGADGKLWVETETNWHRFDPAGALIGTFPTPGRGVCAPRAWLDNGRYVVTNVHYDRNASVLRRYLVVHEWSGEKLTPTDTIQAPSLPDSRTVTFVNESGGSRSIREIPFVHSPGWILATNGLLWVWEGSGAYEIQLRDHAGEVVRTIQRDYDPVSIDASVRNEAIADFDRPGWKAVDDFDASDVPRVYPPFSRVHLADDGSVWVVRQVSEAERSWEVFGADGQFLGSPQVPEELKGLTIRDVGSEYLWGILRDEFDVQYVVRVRIEKPEAGTTPGA